MSQFSNIAVSALTSAVVGGTFVFVNTVELQATSPGTAQTGHINVTGNVLAGSVKVGNGPAGGSIAVDRGTIGNALYARSQGTGVFGQSLSPTGTGYGGYFVSNSSGGRAVFGDSLGTGGNAIGGMFQAASTTGQGVWGRALSTSGSGAPIGVRGTSASTVGTGVLGESPGIAVAGNASGAGTGGKFTGAVAVDAQTASPQGTAVQASAPATDGRAIAVASGDVMKDYGAGYARMVPIAYGTVDGTGAVQSGSGNFTVTKTATGTYQVHIDGFTYVAQTFTTVGSALGNTFGATSLNGDLVVAVTFNSNLVNSDFNFVSYKSSGTGPSFAPKHRFKNDTEWARNRPEEFRRYLAAGQRPTP
ncbi:MAG: hypothetical protein JST30_07295 [Armatimonadetes bacterium]|nr:hypothetical protein [Armatimonadota bacterium]